MVRVVRIDRVQQKQQGWSSCKAHGAPAWQRHVKRRATPQMGRSCCFYEKTTPWASGRAPEPLTVEVTRRM